MSITTRYRNICKCHNFSNSSIHFKLVFATFFPCNKFCHIVFLIVFWLINDNFDITLVLIKVSTAEGTTHCTGIYSVRPAARFSKFPKLFGCHPPYLENEKHISHKTSQSFCFWLLLKNMLKHQVFQNFPNGFSVPKRFRNVWDKGTGPADHVLSCVRTFNGNKW